MPPSSFFGGTGGLEMGGLGEFCGRVRLDDDRGSGRAWQRERELQLLPILFVWSLMKSSHKLSRMVDRKKKLALIEYIRRRQNVAGNEILIPADLYFGGYDDPHCTICANNS
jgi:hypothetical protein